MPQTALGSASALLNSAAGNTAGLKVLLAAHDHVRRMFLRGQDLSGADEEACVCLHKAGLAPALLAEAHAAVTGKVESAACSWSGDAIATLAALYRLLRRDQRWLGAVGAEPAQLDRYDAAFATALASHAVAPQLIKDLKYYMKAWLSDWVASDVPPNVDMSPPESGFFIHASALGLGPALAQALDEATLYHVDRLAQPAYKNNADLAFTAYSRPAQSGWTSVVPAARAVGASHLASAVAWARSHLACGSRAAYHSLLPTEELTVDQLLVHVLLRARLTHFQTLIMSFPDSIPALHDIQVCLDARASFPSISTAGEPPDPVAETAQALLAAWRESILLPATPTDVLVEFFVMLIHACRATLSDGGQVLLSHLVPPLRATLRSRSDTIDVVVSALLGKGAACRLIRPALGRAPMEHMLDGEVGSRDSVYEADNVDDAADEDNSDDDAAVVGRVWKPRPRHAGPAYRRTGQSDVVGLLVSIFTDRQGFVSALERAFATQLLLLDGYDAQEQVRARPLACLLMQACRYSCRSCWY